MAAHRQGMVAVCRPFEVDHMGWEIEYEEVDKAEGQHRFGLIEKGVKTRDGSLARFLYVIVLGTGTDGESCPHCTQKVNRGFELHADGALRHPEGEHKPFELVQAKIAELNDFHSRMDSYTKRHGATMYKGPK